MLSEINNIQAKKIISVTGEYKPKMNVIKADKIVIDDDATITFSGFDKGFYAIVAKEIIFLSPKFRATIQRTNETFHAPDGIEGENGGLKPPTPKKASNGNRGLNGINGGTGKSGGVGSTIDLPPLIIAADIVKQQSSSISRGFIDLRIKFNGLNGGRGGRGGNGGEGGDGGGGGNGVEAALWCADEVGDGGTGGNGGMGGKGGDGGRGGNGADIFYIGNRQALDELELARVTNRGGLPGQGGVPGRPGKPGSGGARGERSRAYCQGGENGAGGQKPNPESIGYGNNSKIEGRDGVIRSIEYRVSQLF